MDDKSLEFPKLLKQKQNEMGLNNIEFAKYLWRNRAWLAYVYNNDFNKAHKLAEHNMLKINELLGIPLEVMLEYNIQVVKNRGV